MMSMDHEYTSGFNERRLAHLRWIQNDSLKNKGIELLEKSKSGDVEAVRGLLSQGAPFMSDALGSSPLHWSVKNKHHTLTELLLKAGVPRDVRNKVDRTPLHISAELGDSLSAELLLSYGATVDAEDFLKMRPLHWAAESGDVKTVKILLDYGTDFLAKNKFGNTAQDIAIKKHHSSVFRLIRKFQTIDKTIRAQKTQTLLEHVKPAVVFLNESVSSNLEPSSCQKEYADETFESFKRKFSDLIEEESRSGDEDILEKVSESALQRLKSHGINLLESLHDSALKTAVEHSQRLVLTEAGKLALSAFDKLFPGRNLPPPPADMIEATSTDGDHTVSDDVAESERQAKELELLGKKENLRRQISFQKSQASALRKKLKTTESRIQMLEDELNSIE